jgi:hypothetical protein
MKKWQFLRGDKFEDVEPEDWVWGVVYEDNTELHQFADDGIFHQFREIEQERVKMFVMYRLADLTKRIDMPVKPEMQIFHFYRKCHLNVGTESDRWVKVYVFGWKDRLTGATGYHYILPDGRMIVANHDIEIISNYNL